MCAYHIQNIDVLGISLPSLIAANILALTQALDLYRQLLAREDADPIFHTYAAACLYYMGLYDQAEAAANEVALPCRFWILP